MRSHCEWRGELGAMADGLGFFGGGGNYSDSSESDSDAEDEHETVAVQQTGADGKAPAAKEKEGTREGGEGFEHDPPVKKSSLPSFADAMKSTEGLAASFTTEGATKAAGAHGLQLTDEQRAIAERKDDSYYSGNMGMRSDLSAIGKTAHINLDISKARDVPRSVVQRLRGKDGRGLQQMTMKTGARIVCEQELVGHEDDDAPRRVMVVGDAEAVAKALEIVDGMVREDSKEVCITVMCPAHCVGAVIGKGGECIKRIQRETACKVFVHGRRDVERFAGNVGFNSHGNDDEPPRKVQCTGAPKSAKAASDQVKKIILQVERELGLEDNYATKRMREEAENDAMVQEDELFEREEKKRRAKAGKKKRDDDDAIFGGTLSEGLGLGRHW